VLLLLPDSRLISIRPWLNLLPRLRSYCHLNSSRSIFAFVSYDRPHVDIANIRLASRQFHDLSSPFLLDTVVISNRLDTLQKTSEVLDHPYFSKYITRLVWDASYYGYIEDLRQYQEICEKDVWRSSADDTYYESLKSDEKPKVALIEGAMDLSMVRPKICPRR
jgi:hypothetical protein